MTLLFFEINIALTPKVRAYFGETAQWIKQFPPLRKYLRNRAKAREAKEWREEELKYKEHRWPPSHYPKEFGYFTTAKPRNNVQQNAQQVLDVEKLLISAGLVK